MSLQVGYCQQGMQGAASKASQDVTSKAEQVSGVYRLDVDRETELNIDNIYYVGKYSRYLYNKNEVEKKKEKIKKKIKN